MQVLSGSFPVLFSWLGDAQHSPQEILDSPSQLRLLDPYLGSLGGFCTPSPQSCINEVLKSRNK